MANKMCFTNKYSLGGDHCHGVQNGKLFCIAAI